MAVKLCPMCRNRPINTVSAHFANQPCEYCGGQGMLNTDLSCKCGRPAIHRLNGVDYCTRYECGKAVIEATK